MGEGDCTRHARVRMQQRGINDDALDLLMRVGGMYAVLGTDGVIVTVGHRYRRIPKG